MQDLCFKKIHIDLNNLLSDPRLWKNVLSFHLNYQDEIRRAYSQRGSCLPLDHNFLKKEISEALCRFNPN